MVVRSLVFMSQNGKGAHLCDKNAGDTLCDTQQRLLGILLGLTESFPQVCGIRQNSSAVLSHGVQVSLLGERLVRHSEEWGVLDEIDLGRVGGAVAMSRELRDMR